MSKFILQGCSLALTLLFILGNPAPVMAQVLYGSIVGNILDPSGAVVPNAALTVINKGTGVSRQIQADSQGSYNAQNLQPGQYEVKAEVSGFRATTKTDIPVTAGTVSRVDFTLEVGQTAETISVEAAAVALQTDKSATQSQISTRPIATLPLSTYRNYQSLINLVPGATPAALQNSATDTPGRSLSTNINGTPRNMNTTRLDGAVNVNIWLPHHNSYVAPSETVAEVNVSTTALDAEIGSAGGAAVTVTTKSGTNEFHGSAWEYHNNQRLKARPYFMPSAQQKPRDTLNIFGATLGGPIVRNKLFFFGHYEGTRQRVGGNGIYDVPTADVRNGDFSQAINTGATSPTIIYDPRTGNADGTGRSPFPGNRIPMDRISGPARRLMDLLPGPNMPGRVQNFAVGATGIFDRNNYDYKINYNRNEKHMMFGKSSFLVADVTGIPAFGELVGPAVVQDPGTGHTFTQIHTIGQTYVFTPNLLLDQTLGFNRQTQNVIGLDYGKNWGSEVLGIPGTNGGDDIRYSGMPAFSFGYTAVGQTGTWIPMWRTEQSWTNSNNLTWTKGKHDVRFGFNVIRFNLNHWQPEVANPRGNFAFNGNYTSLNGGATANFYNTFAAFLLGGVNTASKSLQYNEMTGREWQFNWYIRDRWQITRNFTLNFGLKYDWYPLMTRRHTGLEQLDPYTNTVYLGGRGNIPTNAGLSINAPGFAPSVGMAYRVRENTVIRAGYGMTWDPMPFSRPLRGWYPLTVSSTFASDNSYVANYSLDGGIPAFTGPDESLGAVPLPTTADMRSPWGKINRGYIQSWNFTIQQKLPANLLGSIAYVGTKSTNLLADRNINAAAPGTNTLDTPFGQLFNRRIATNMWDGWLSSNYHSLQATLDRSFSNGLFLKGAYTFGKAINFADDNGWQGISWNWEPTIHRNRARAGYDRTHILQMAWSYDLPIGKGKKFFKEGGPVGYILGNWTVSGVFYKFTGNPLTVTSDAACNCPGGTQTANQVGPINRIGGVGPGQKYYDPSSFVAGAANTFGNTGRNIIEGPGRIGSDLNIARIFPIGERFRFEIRADAFNVTNTPAFSNPTLNVNSATYMEIRSSPALSERQLRFGGIIRF